MGRRGVRLSAAVLVAAVLAALTACSGAHVEVNGAAVSEPYLYPGDSPSWQQFSAKVPAGDLWVMGDHRDVAMDSRVHQAFNGQGFVPVANALGVYRP